MGASSVTGVGIGSAESQTGIKNNDKVIASLINEPRIVASGDITSYENWQIAVYVAGLTLTPDNYSVFVFQSDFGNSDGRANHPCHIEKIDINGYNFCDNGGEWVDPMGGFIFHTADYDFHNYNFIVVQNHKANFVIDHLF